MAIIKQFVNLPTGVTSHEGNRRALFAEPVSVPSVQPSDTVEWWIEPGGSNTDIVYITPASRARLQFPTTLITAATGRFHNRIDLPHVGGDEYVVKCSKLNNRPNFFQTDTFQTWRKLFYTVFHMGADSLAQYNALEGQFQGAFSRSFIELQKAATIATMTVMDEARVEFTNNFPFVDGSTSAIINLKRAGLATGTGSLSNKPFHMAYMVVPRAFFTRPRPRTMAATRAIIGSTSYFHLLYTEPGNPVAFIPVARASWGANSFDVRNSFSIVSNAGGASSIQWNLNTVPGLTAWLAAPANTFNLTFTVTEKSSINGYSWGNICVVGMTGRPPIQVLGTMVHEMGHAVQQAVHFESRWNATGTPMASDVNPNWYDDVFGGQGPHCSTNAVLTTTAALTSGKRFVWGGGAKLCTMYHAGDVNRDDGVFCPSCEPRVRRANLNSTNMTNQQWNFFG